MNEAKPKGRPPAKDHTPAKLANGKLNPAYRRLYYQQNKKKILGWIKKFKNTEKGKASIYRANHSPAAVARVARYRKKVKDKARGGVVEGHVKCIECGCTYERLVAIERGYQLVLKNGCVCDLCV